MSGRILDDNGNPAVGLVDDAPAANSILGRLKTIADNITSAVTSTVLAAGSAIIGKVGIDQTTPGTTNGVQVNAALPAGTNNIGDVDVASIAAGETHVGEVGGNSAVKKPTITLTTSAYTDGDCIGGVVEVTNWSRSSGKGTVLQNIALKDVEGINPVGWLLFFDASPSASTLTDADPAAVHADDAAKLVAMIPVATADWVDEADAGGISIAEIDGGGKVIVPAATSVWMAFVVNGTPDWASTTSLSIAIGLLRD